MPSFAVSDRVQLAYVSEATFGVTPTSGATSRALRLQSESLALNKTDTADKELTPDAQPNGSTTLDINAGGDIKVHMQYAEYDPLIAGALRSAWVAFGTNGVGATFSGSFTAGTAGTVASTITAGAATSGSSIFTNLQPGQWFMLNAPATANDGKWVRNSLSVAATSTVVTLDVNTPLAAGTTVAGCSIATSRVSNATTQSSFTLERQATDVGRFFAYRGQNVSKFSMDRSSAAYTDASFSFMGKDEVTGAATTLPGALTASQTYEIHSGITGAGSMWINGAPLTSTSIKKVSTEVDAKLRYQGALDSLGAVGIGMGTIEVKGKLEVYFADGALYSLFTNGTYVPLTYFTRDPAGNGYVITIPRAKLSNGKVNAGGKDSDLMATFDYEGFADRANTVPALRKTIIIDRLGAAVAP